MNPRVIECNCQVLLILVMMHMHYAKHKHKALHSLVTKINNVRNGEYWAYSKRNTTIIHYSRTEKRWIDRGIAKPL